MKGLIIFLIFLFAINFASAFGVATLYSDNYPLRMRPGETKETFFLLRNVVEGDSDVIIKSELTSGADVAKLIDGAKTYEVPFGSELEVPIRVEVPEGAEIGSQYRIGAIFRPTPTKIAEGNIQFIVNIGKSFPVLVVSEPVKVNEGGETLSLTIESDELLDTFAPFLKGSTGIFLTIIFFFIAGIIIVIVLIISFAIKAGKGSREFTENNLVQTDNISRPY